jgi:alpha-L-arabinofuranosidase
MHCISKNLWFAIVLLLGTGLPKLLQGQQATARLLNTKEKIIINKNIYGHFAEHLGACIYGGFYVGEQNKTIPQTEGIRNDVIAALRKLKVPVLRWPGGCFADTYHWKDGVGPKDKRPTMVNAWWGGVTEDNSFGTHDFLNMCEKIGAAPYLAGNIGSGTVRELADWVQYVNFSGVSPMSKLRQQNGRAQPWQVQFWGVGNEAWGCGGNMTPAYYANEYRKYATFMTNYLKAGKMFRIASGASSDDYNWTETMMHDIPLWMIEGIALHHYSVIKWEAKGSATAFSEKQYAASMAQAIKMEELITKHSAIMNKYDKDKKIALVVDEWGGWYDVEPGTNAGFLFQQNTMRDAMIAGVTLNIFNNHADRVRMANLAQTINVLQAVLLTNKEKLLFTPTYHVMEMFNVHQDATLIPVELESPRYINEHDTLPAISISASVDSAGQTHISLVNIDAAKANSVNIDLGNAAFKTATGRILVSAHLQDYNSFDAADKIKPVSFSGASINANHLFVNLPPASVVVLTLQ